MHCRILPLTAESSPETASSASPASSGPAGAHFEGQVAAHYLLTMLADAEPRGLPGATIARVALQRAGEGNPLDDVIVHARGRTGQRAVLEVQVKRTVMFSPGDLVFKDVIHQLARAVSALDLAEDHHQFAVAIERTSYKITGPYQDVLRWARELGDAATLFGRLARPGVASDDMRKFVATVRGHLETAGCRHDDEIVWHLLRRFQILPFDYAARGSQALELATERATHVLDASDTARAGAFWRVLTETAIRVASSGGDLDRAGLAHDLSTVGGFRLAGGRRNRAVRDDLAEAAQQAAGDLKRSIGGATLARTAQVDAVRAKLDVGRYVEIRGAAGVGKSGVLCALVEQVLREGRAIVLAPGRTIPRGWLAFKSALHIEGTAQEFLSDLASDGGGTLFIDSLDFFADLSERKTVIDLVSAAATVPSFEVVVSARVDFDKDEPNWLPRTAIERLKAAPPVLIQELGAEEIEELRSAAPQLRALLADDHPARAVTRNLFRLSRLVGQQGDTARLRSEIDMVERWWTTADGAMDDDRRERSRLLADLANVLIAGGDRLATRAPAQVVDALVRSGSLRELGRDRLFFHHDVFREWAVAAGLNEAPDKIDELPLSKPVPASLARGVELAARYALVLQPVFM